MKTILVPTDFSENAMHAARYAASLARVYDSNIIFINIYTMRLIFEYEAVSVLNTSLDEMQKIAELNLIEFRENFIKNTNFTPERVSQIAEYGSITATIVEKSEGNVIDMIVMGTKGAHNIFDGWVGTNAEKVGKLAHCPVWIIPEKAKLDYPLNIMYAADFKEDEKVAAEKLLKIAKPLGATCKVVHVHEYFEPKIGHQVEDAMAQLEKYFEDENITFKEINRPLVINGLEKYIQGYNPDVIAIAVHQKSFIAKLFDFGVSSHFLQKSDLPILTFRN